MSLILGQEFHGQDNKMFLTNLLANHQKLSLCQQIFPFFRVSLEDIFELNPFRKTSLINRKYQRI